MTPKLSVARRDFLAAAASFTVVAPNLVRGSQANTDIRIGLIGCGGRGTWIAPLFQDAGGYKWVAGADYFEDRVNNFGTKFNVPADARSTTLSAYKKLLDRQDIDAVVIETPPYFHPEQAADAVAAGKHVYVAKPIAVDVPGCQSIAESGKKATEAKKVFLVDFQTRAHPTYRELMTRVKSGAIGTLIGADAHYPWSGIVADVPTPTPEDRLRSWYGVLALSGDCIVEQDIHALDVACWFAGSDPIKAYGTGGKAIRKHGQIWDHFALTFVYPNDFEVTFSSHKGTPGVKDEISVRAFGTEGLALTDYYGPVQIAGKNPFPGATMTDMYAAGTKVNIAEFREAVKSGDCANATVPESVRSNLTCVLGRTAAYRGKEVTLSEILGSAEKLEADLQGLKS